MKVSKLYHAAIIMAFLSIPSFFQAQENSTLSLNGQWEIIFDEKNEGREAQWMKADVFNHHPGRKKIMVPIAWETIKEDYEGVAFYRRTFQVPADWEGKIIRLQFGAVNYLSEIWLNDEVVGFHEGGFTPFEFRVDEMTKAGEENVLTLRVVGPLFLSDKEIDGMKALETPQWRGGISGGIWQSVQLLATEETYIDDVFIQPDIYTNTADFQLSIEHAGTQNITTELDVRIIDTAKPSMEKAQMLEKIDLHPGVNHFQYKMKIPDAIYWSPDNPHLYQAQVMVKSGGKHSHSWKANFGMRELTIKDKDFYLNGKRIYIKASFFEGIYPNGIAYPDSEEMARREIRLAKEAGFNMIRPWRRPPAPMWLDLADEMGVLVVGSPALECMQLPLSTPYLPSRVENEVRQAILRDRNRACIIQWELFNELHRPVLKQMMRPMAMLARNLDPTRLILDESGGWAYGANMYLPHQYEPTKFNDIHNYPGPFINHNQYDGYLSIGMNAEEKQAAGLKGQTPGRNVVPGLMSYVSELGYGSLPDLTINNQLFQEKGNALTPAYRYHHRIHQQQQEILRESGFSYLYPDMQQFYLDQQEIHGSANKRMIEAVRANPEVDGYCIHALVAGDWILGAGLLDLWRNPKSYAYQATRAANQPRILSIRTGGRNIYAEKGCSLEITGINELEAIDIKLQMRIYSGKKLVLSRKLNKKWDAGVSRLFNQKLDTKNWKGNYSIKVNMVSDKGDIIAENEYTIGVFREKDIPLSRKQVAIIDQKGFLKAYLQNANASIIDFHLDMDISTPVFVTGTHLKETNLPAQDLKAFMQAGGTVVFLDGASASFEEGSDIFPFSAKVHPARGLWTCIPHLLKEHPFFEDLPVNTMMRDIYENVWARNTLRNIRTESGKPYEAIVGAMGFDWFSPDHKMHYSGPGESWWGADMAVIAYGKGKCVVSQLHLSENLGHDPAADMILGNMMRYYTR